jgi:DNA-binding MarR family transcriptional regulator
MDGSQDHATFRIGSTPTYLVRAIAERNFVNLKRALERHNIGPVGWRILGALRENDGCNIAQLADLTATDRSNLGRAVVELERQGFVTRRPAPRDRRNILLSLTPAGQRKLDEILPVVLRIVDETLDGFSPDEVETLMSLLRRMAANVRRAATV